MSKSQLKIAVNENGLIRNMSNLFSDKANVIFELTQNAARAGADLVQLTFKADHPSKLTITDNGAGIQDFQTLFTIAESNWEDHINEQNPFGMGFISTLFTAERIVIKSNGKMVDATCEDIAKGKTIEIQESTFNSGTSIELFNINKQLNSFMCDVINGRSAFAFYGQKLQVNLNDIVLSNDDALSNLETNDQFVRTDFEYGTVFSNVSATNINYRTYLQGVNLSKERFDAQASHIVHLADNTPARMPDRHNLLDEAEVYAAILNTISDVMNTLILKRVASMDGGELAGNKHLFNLVSSFCPEHLTSVDYLPAHYFVSGTNMNIALNTDAYGFHNEFHASHIFSRETLEQTTVVSMPIAYECEYNTDRCYLSLMNDVLVVNHASLPNEHWFNQKNVLDTEEMDITLSCENQRNGEYLDTFYGLRLICCDEINLDGPLGTINASTRGIYQDECLYVTLKTDIEMALSSICHYRNEWHDYMEEVFEADVALVSQAMSEIYISDPSDIIVTALARLIHASLNTLKGKQFTISISDDNNVTVEKNPNQLLNQ